MRIKPIRGISLMAVAMLVNVLLLGCSTTENNTKNKLKTEKIRSEGKYGTVEEERVKAMSSEARYIPKGSRNGYLLVDPSLADPKENAYRNPEKLVIPSFTIKTW